MSDDIKELVKEKLCPDGVWRFSDPMQAVFNGAIYRFPNKETTETEERYPTTKSGMGAYLDKFFARHYFQVQDSLLDYMVSEPFLEAIYNGYINILDIGSGPAVASLAIADLVGCITEILAEIQKINSKVRLNFVLNDTSSICLGLGKEMLFDYFKKIKSLYDISLDRAFFLDRQFPRTLMQFKRIAKNLNPFNIIVFSYVIVPLDEQDVDINSGIKNLKKICTENGQILIVQDKYNEELISQIENDAEKRSVTHLVYSEQNINSSYSYEYYCSLVPCES
ncbi:MAG: hypothetical protein NTW93_06910 [Phycisphaerae bacterium]|jgi:ribosomal protein RSM22 (predicted rRNA methylase)|nr:hypothetical protein [Phycisphaerae bacterium]